MHLGDVAHLEVAHGDARKVDGVGRVLAVHDVLHDLDAVEVEVLVAEEEVEQEELTERVGQVEELDHEVEHDEVGAADGRLQRRRRAADDLAAVGAHAAAARGVREAQLLDVAVALLAHGAGLAAAARERVLIDRLDHVEHDLVAILEFLGGLIGARRLHEVGNVETGLGGQGAPYEARHVEEERLKEQYERHPLVVLEHAALAVRLVLAQVLVHGRVERVRHPAHLIDVVDVVLHKVARRPAHDLLGAELLVRHDDAEYDEQDDGVLVVEAVGDHRVVAMMAEY